MPSKGEQQSWRLGAGATSSPCATAARSALSPPLRALPLPGATTAADCPPYASAGNSFTTETEKEMSSRREPASGCCVQRPLLPPLPLLPLLLLLLPLLLLKLPGDGGVDARVCCAALRAASRLRSQLPPSPSAASRP